MSKRDTFIQCVVQRPPGLLAHFDICQMKMRNDTLGFDVGDRDIRELDTFIRASVGTSGLAVQISAQQWLAYYEATTTEAAAFVLKRFYQEQPIRAGWTLATEKNGETQKIKKDIQTKIRRAVRCIYARMHPGQNIEKIIHNLEINNHHIPPNQPMCIDDLEKTERRFWSCIESDPHRDARLYCLLCHSTKLEHCGIDTEPDYTCENCGAHVSLYLYTS